MRVCHCTLAGTKACDNCPNGQSRSFHLTPEIKILFNKQPEPDFNKLGDGKMHKGGIDESDLDE